MNPGEYNGTTTNQVRRSIQMLISTSTAGVTVTLSAPAQEPATTATITQDSLANIQIPTVTVTTTWAAFKKNGILNLPFTINYFPNSAIAGGYQGFVYIGTSSMNLNYLSSHYFNYQAIPLLANNPATLLFFTLTSGGQRVNDWFENSVGVALAQTWATNSVVQVANSFGSKKGTSASFNIAFSYANFLSLPFGQYWYPAYALMQPYTTPPLTTALINTILTNAETQILTRNSFIGLINNLTDMSVLGKTITTANKALLEKQINEIIKGTNAYLTTLSQTSGATTEVLESITAAKATLNTFIP
jgi:hypothetical protein